MPERSLAEVAAVLVGKAEEDATAVRLFAANDEIGDHIVGFHAQQAIEKWLKAVLASRGEKFEYTHDLHRLVMQVTHDSGELPADVDAIIALTQYAVPLRYADVLDAEPLDRDTTLKLVDAMHRWAEAKLKSDQ
ncbi:MAG: HEPN domain-containing protein [Solirubrobacterales bacterium]